MISAWHCLFVWHHLICILFVYTHVHTVFMQVYFKYPLYAGGFSSLDINFSTVFLQNLRLIYTICLVSMPVTSRHLAFNMTKEFVCFSSVHYIIHQLPKLKISDLSWNLFLTQLCWLCLSNAQILTLHLRHGHPC